MKKICTGLALAIITLTSCAQDSLIIKLWPNGAPTANGLSGEETKNSGGSVGNVSNPTLTVYRAKQPNGMAIIACPGGGYMRLAMNHEGYDMAPWFNAQGITYAVLKYRMPNGHPDVPLSDAQQALKLMREHAKEWAIDPKKVGIMGASAGGHLAATAATHFTSDADRPDFQILFYPWIIMDAMYGQVLLGKQPGAELVKKFSNEQQVTARTPQAFILTSADDPTVPCDQSIKYFEALNASKVPASLHIYPTGKHGWGYKDSFTYKQVWTAELEKWLKEINK